MIESSRDQLSFNYACYATKFRYNELIYDSVIVDDKNRFFNWNRFHNKNIQKKSSQLNTDDITIAICNFNTTKMTCNCIESICRNSKLPNMKFVILDNSYPMHKFKIPDYMKKIKCSSI